MSVIGLADRISEHLIEPSIPFAPRAEVNLGQQDLASDEEWARLKPFDRTVPITHIRVRDAVLDPQTGLIFQNGEIVERLRYGLYPGEEAEARERIRGPAVQLFERQVFLGFNRYAPANYSHWITQVIPALHLYERETDFSEGLVLLPPLAFPAQVTSARIMLANHPHILQLKTDAPVEIGELVVSSLLIDQTKPYPAALPAYRMVAQAVAGSHGPADRLIYVWRLDSSARRIRNEDTLVNRLVSRGIEPIICSTMSFSEQIEAFSRARLVVSPHGAGLANLAFCSKGAVLYELFPHHYVSWVPALYAQMIGMPYFADAFRAEARPDLWRHQTPWSVDLDVVERRLDEIFERFLT